MNKVLLIAVKIFVAVRNEAGKNYTEDNYVTCCNFNKFMHELRSLHTLAFQWHIIYHCFDNSICFKKKYDVLP